MSTTAAYEPYAPRDTPKEVARDVWVVDGPEIRFGPPGFKFPHPTRMTVVRLAGGLWLHSPTRPTEPLLAALERYGPVRFLIAPNNFHYSWIADWKARFPDAGVWGPSRLRLPARPALPRLQPLSDRPDGAWASAVDQFLVRGNLLTEAVFFHRSTRTLILTDLIENFESSRVRSRSLRRLLVWAGITDQDGRRPLDMRLAFLFRRKTLRAAVERMIDGNPEGVILAHGRWFSSVGTDALRHAFRWVLEG